MKWLLKHKVLSLMMVVAYLGLLISFTYRLPNQSLTLTGDLSPVNTIVDESKDPHFYTIYVVSMDRPTLFQYFIATLSKKIDVSPLPDAYKGISALDQYKMGQIAEEISYQYATIQAYTKANLVDPTITISYESLGYIVSYVDPLQFGIELGDILIEVESVSHTNVPQSEFFGYFSNQDTVTVKVLRDNELKTLTLHKVPSIDRYGIRLEPYFEIDTTPPLTTNYQTDFIGGPSGGLIQTLDLYMKLLNIDLKALKIAGTGTIELDGTIGEIGGIEQKIWTAYDHDIDLFFCGEANYDAALAVYETLKNPQFQLIKVGDFDEAINIVMARLS